MGKILSKGLVFMVIALFLVLLESIPAQAGTVIITTPQDNAEVTSKVITIEGRVLSSAGVKINGQEALASAQGSFTKLVTLRPGVNTIKITDLEGNGAKSLRVTFDDTPIIRNLEPSNNRVLYTNRTAISGQVVNGQTLTINGSSVPLDSTGKFSYTVKLNPGYSDYIIKAASAYNTVTQRSLRLVYDNGQPLAVVTEPTQGTTVEQSGPVIKGYVRNAAALKINGQTVYTNSLGEFSYTLPGSLTPGSNTLTLEAGLGNVTKNYTHSFFYLSNPVITLTYPENGAMLASKNITVKGTATGGYSLYISQRSGSNEILSERAVYTGSEGKFEYGLELEPGENEITLKAVRGSGVITKTITVNYDSRPGLLIKNVLVNGSSVWIEGTAANAQKIRINGNETQLGYQGDFTQNLTLASGTNSIIIEAIDGDLVTTKVIALSPEECSAMVEIDAPLDEADIDGRAVLVKGRARDLDYEGLLINGTVVNPDSDGYFTKIVSMGQGSKYISIRATRGYLTVVKYLTVYAQGQSDLSVLEPTDGEVVFSNILTVSGAAYAQGTLKLNGKVVSMDEDGIFSSQITLRPGTNTLTVIATKEKTTTKQTIKVNFSQLLIPGAYRQVPVPGNGGSVNFFDNRAILTFPKGTFREDKNLKVKILEPGAYRIPAARELASFIVRVDLPDTPLNPTALALKFSDTFRTVLHKNIALFFYDPALNSWRPVGGKIDSKKGMVQGSVPGSGVYAAMAYYNSFDDIFDHQLKEDIEILVARGIINGTTPTTFEPEKIITRAQFATMLVRALEVPLSKPARPSFTDVPSNNWAYNYIETAIRKGFVLGTSVSRFSPDAPITREQAAVMLARSANLAPLKEEQLNSVLTGFKDEGSISVYAKNGVALAVKNKLLIGTDNRSFSPKTQTTRAQAAKMVVRLLNQLKKI